MNFLDEISNDDFIWRPIANQLTGRVTKTTNVFITLNCPLCVSRGETPDKRGRFGITRSHQGIGFNCFNCGAKGGWSMGQNLSKAMQDMLLGLGVDSTEVKRIAHRAMVLQYFMEDNGVKVESKNTTVWMDFPARNLPKDSKLITELLDEDCKNVFFNRVLKYLDSRGEVIIQSSNYYWSPEYKNYLIIPCYYQNNIVGWIGRAAISSIEKYHNDIPNNFLFNNKALLDPTRYYVILVEGPTDALAIDGVGLLGAKVNDQQISWINQSEKQVILLPDRDKTGMRMIDIALQNDWGVSYPRLSSGGKISWWDNDVKDADEAVKRYGRLYTLRSIIESTVYRKNMIELYRRMFI